MLFQTLNLLTVVASGLMMWKGLCLLTNSESPIVVVLSYVSSSLSHFLLRNVFGLITEGKLGVYCKSCRGSMEPAFYRGDILFLMNPADVPYEVGDITVYKVYVSVFLLLICQDGLIGTLVVM